MIIDFDSLNCYQTLLTPHLSKLLTSAGWHLFNMFAAGCCWPGLMCICLFLWIFTLVGPRVIMLYLCCDFLKTKIAFIIYF